MCKVFSSRHLLLEYKYDGEVALPGVQVQEHINSPGEWILASQKPLQ